MISFLLPFIALLGLVRCTEFKQEVRVQFIMGTVDNVPGASFTDVTKYSSDQSKARLSIPADPSGNVMGSLIFTASTQTRTIQWTGQKDDKTPLKKEVSPAHRQ